MRRLNFILAAIIIHFTLTTKLVFAEKTVSPNMKLKRSVVGSTQKSKEFHAPGDYRFEFLSKKRLKDFQKMGLSEQHDFLIRRAKEELLPNLSRLLGKVDTKFVGVQGFANDFCCPAQFQKNSVECLTDSSGKYWKARIEMVPGDYTILLAKCLLYTSHGQIDLANRTMQFLRPYQNLPALGAEFFFELRTLLNAYIDQRSNMIKKGINAFDRGDRDAAISIYKKVLDIDPTSAWAWHEYFLSKVFDEASPDYLRHFQSNYCSKVYKADPLYPMGMSAHTGVEAFQIWRRMEINELFKNHDSIRTDILNYANIALDVNAFGMAAELYWQVFPLLPDGKRDRAIDGFLYCLEKLGVTNIKSIFVGEPKVRFRRVEKSARYRLENNTMYNLKIK